MATTTGALPRGAAWLRRLGARVWLAHAPVAVLLLAYYLSVLIVAPGAEAQMSLSLVRLFLDLKFVLILMAFFGTIYGYTWLVLHRSERPYRVRFADWLRRTPFIEILLARFLPAALALGVLQTCFLAFKPQIPNLVPFAWDGILAQADRALFMGVDPWVLTHALFPGPAETQALGIAYGLWFHVIFGAFAIAGMMRLDSRLRLTFLLSFFLAWTVAGSLLAVLFSSAGPVYMERVVGDPTFAPLMQRLAEQGEVVKLAALGAQENLWRGYAEPGQPAMGISAFPSLHLCIATLVTFFAFGHSRLLGWALVAFTTTVMIGSVHLGWHYAVDGFAGIALAAVFWKASRRFADRWFQRASGPEAVDGLAPG